MVKSVLKRIWAGLWAIVRPWAWQTWRELKPTLLERLEALEQAMIMNHCRGDGEPLVTSQDILDGKAQRKLDSYPAVPANTAVEEGENCKMKTKRELNE